MHDPLSGAMAPLACGSGEAHNPPSDCIVGFSLVGEPYKNRNSPTSKSSSHPAPMMEGRFGPVTAVLMGGGKHGHSCSTGSLRVLDDTQVQSSRSSGHIGNAQVSAGQDHTLTEKVVGWIEGVTGTIMMPLSMAEWLKDGVVLCELFNVIRPGSISVIHRVASHSVASSWKHMENIQRFTAAMCQLGVRKQDLFVTPDLYEQKNMMAVIKCLYVFGCTVQGAVLGYHGPTLGVTMLVRADQQKEVKPKQTAGAQAQILLQAPLSTQKVVNRRPRCDLTDKDRLEEEVIKWIGTVTGLRKGSSSTAGWLKDGVVLCGLINAIRSKTISKINKPGFPWTDMENIKRFTDAARGFGVKESAMFATPDLYEEKNLDSVVNCVYMLGSVIQTEVPEFTGPMLGKPMAFVRDAPRDRQLAQMTGGLASTMERKQLTIPRQVHGHSTLSDLAGGLREEFSFNQDLNLSTAHTPCHSRVVCPNSHPQAIALCISIEHASSVREDLLALSLLKLFDVKAKILDVAGLSYEGMTSVSRQKKLSELGNEMRTWGSGLKVFCEVDEETTIQHFFVAVMRAAQDGMDAITEILSHTFSAVKVVCKLPDLPSCMDAVVNEDDLDSDEDVWGSQQVSEWRSALQGELAEIHRRLDEAIGALKDDPPWILDMLSAARVAVGLPEVYDQGHEVEAALAASVRPFLKSALSLSDRVDEQDPFLWKVDCKRRMSMVSKQLDCGVMLLRPSRAKFHLAMTSKFTSRVRVYSLEMGSKTASSCSQLRRWSICNSSEHVVLRHTDSFDRLLEGNSCD